MNILITGASGFIGHALTEHLRTQGHEVFTLGRRPTQTPHHFHWQPRAGKIELDTEIAFDAVINLAGENIASRWTASKKDEILMSRVSATQLLCDTLSKLPNPPKVLINGSAMGYYGDTKDAVVEETSAPGTGFLAQVAKNWEEAAKPAVDAGIRTVYLRTGLVTHPDGGALQQMLLPFKLGLGGRLGDGLHYMSWISLRDAVSSIAFILAHPTISGPVNMVSPQPVTNSEFTEALGKALHRPTIFPMPAPIARLIFGEMADEALLASIRVYPQVLLKAGFEFQHPELSSYLVECLR